jgi:pimeloyl-ACP methyl ester carboxylesterase
MLLKITSRTRRRIGPAILGAAVGAPVAAALGAIAYSALFIPHELPLPPALPGERREFEGRAGRLSYYAAGSGAPLLLIHSINAAASAYEMRPLFEHYRRTRRVYALDLPGFGFSDRSPRPYSPRLYADAILDLLDAIAYDAGPAPVDAAALSLGSEFLARAASQHPGRFRTLALITPTGFGKDQSFYGAPGSTRGSQAVRRLFEFPLWSRPFFDLLNSRASQRYFLKQTFGSYAAIDTGLLDYDYLTAHQPDAQYAPYAFIAGTLFSADIDRVYAALTMPVWLPYGTRDGFTDFGGVDKVTARGNWTVQPFPTGGLPYFERPERFFAAYDAFLSVELTLPY